jgi:hypothetical protein
MFGVWVAEPLWKTCSWSSLAARTMSSLPRLISILANQEQIASGALAYGFGGEECRNA